VDQFSPVGGIGGPRVTSPNMQCTHSVDFLFEMNIRYDQISTIDSMDHPSVQLTQWHSQQIHSLAKATPAHVQQRLAFILLLLDPLLWCIQIGRYFMFGRERPLVGLAAVCKTSTFDHSMDCVFFTARNNDTKACCSTGLRQHQKRHEDEICGCDHPAVPKYQKGATALHLLSVCRAEGQQ
jgi:hypothetical protein